MNKITVKIGDIATVRRGASPRPINDYIADYGMPWLKIADIESDGKYIKKTKEFIINNGVSKSVIVHPGDLVLSNSASPGIPQIMKITACIHDGWLLLHPKREYIDKDFLFYLLKYSRKKLLSNATGAVFNNLRTDTVANFEVEIPKLYFQKYISSILSAYDDFININIEKIRLLEEAARLLYREWFVYFRFPGHENVKIIDGIPENWKKIKLKNIISSIESGSRPKGGAIEHGIPSIGAENVNGIGRYNYSNEKFVPEEYYQKMKKGKLKQRDVLLYKDGANIGRTSIVGFGFPHKKCCVNEHVFILRSKNNIQNWLYFFLSQEFINKGIANLNSNSAQPGISQDKLLNFKIIFPDEEIVKKFDCIIDNVVKEIFTLSIQNQKLAQARDLLLPRLMSGKIDVFDFDKDNIPVESEVEKIVN